MAERKLDMRYASDRATAAFRKHNQTEVGPPPMYRAELLRAARGDGLRKNEFRNMAATLKLSVNTIREAMEGRATKIETLWILANHFGIAWLQLFDVKNVLEFTDGRPTAIRGLVRRAKVKK